MCTTQKLVEDYVPLAVKLAYQKKRSLPQFISIDELKSAAYLGLTEAASRYDDTKGVQFSTYAYPRIQGAILDYLRELSWGNKEDQSVVCDLESLENCSGVEPQSSPEQLLEEISEDLDEQAKTMMKFYFIDEFSMKEIGKKFGVSESRISQLISSYKQKIKNNWSESDLLPELAA
jgi:RNA polymerase sigma factor FliA